MADSGSVFFQLLSCQVEIHYEDKALEDVFRYLVARPKQPFEVRKTLTYEIRGSGPYSILEEGDLLDRVERPADVLFIVYGRVYRRTLERFVLSGWVALHGALATINGQRHLLLGHKGSGKSTLATRLLYAGHNVEGDEMTLARRGVALALPRAFHLKPNFEALVPELTDLAATLPTTHAGPLEISAVEPSTLDFDWAISTGPIDRVVWITPNHGRETALAPLDSFNTMQRIIESALGWNEGRHVLFAEAARLGATGGYELVLGNAYDAVEALEAPEPVPV